MSVDNLQHFGDIVPRQIDWPYITQIANSISTELMKLKPEIEAYYATNTDNFAYSSVLQFKKDWRPIPFDLPRMHFTNGWILDQVEEQTGINLAIMHRRNSVDSSASDTQNTPTLSGKDFGTESDDWWELMLKPKPSEFVLIHNSTEYTEPMIQQDVETMYQWITAPAIYSQIRHVLQRDGYCALSNITVPTDHLRNRPALNFAECPNAYIVYNTDLLSKALSIQLKCQVLLPTSIRFVNNYGYKQIQLRVCGENLP